MPKNPAGRTDEEQKQHEKSMLEQRQWVARENVRAARGSSTAITDYNAPSVEEQLSAKAFLANLGIPGTPSPDEDFGERMVQPRQDLARFLSPDIEGGFYQEPRGGSKDTGKPQTFEEQQFVSDYLAKYGMKPTVGEGSQFQQTGTYDPESTMGGLGFENYGQYVQAQQKGEAYGPLAGRDVPFNTGIVITDEQGNPTARYMDVNRPEARSAIAEGRYINPTVGPMAEQLRGGFPGGEEYYTQPMGAMPELDMEEAISQYGTPQMYLQGLGDYLDNAVRNDRPNVDAAYDQIEAAKKEADDYFDEVKAAINAGSMDPGAAQVEVDKAYALRDDKLEELYNQIDNVLMTEDRSKIEYAKANDLVLQGTPIGELPYFGEVKPTMWQLSAAEQQRQDVINRGQQPPAWGDYSQEQGTTRNPIKDFLDYADNLDTTPEYKRWLAGKYEYYKAQWENSGEPDFIPWLNDTLARG